MIDGILYAFQEQQSEVRMKDDAADTHIHAYIYICVCVRMYVCILLYIDTMSMSAHQMMKTILYNSSDPFVYGV